MHWVDFSKFRCTKCKGFVTKEEVLSHGLCYKCEKEIMNQEKESEWCEDAHFMGKKLFINAEPGSEKFQEMSDAIHKTKKCPFCNKPVRSLR